MKITVAVFDGSPNARPTVDLVKRILVEEGVIVPVEIVHVEDTSAAETFRFLGSPTVRINGIDIDPARRSDTTYALTCRVYPTEAGSHGVPPDEMVRSAVREAG